MRPAKAAHGGVAPAGPEQGRAPAGRATQISATGAGSRRSRPACRCYSTFPIANRTTRLFSARPSAVALLATGWVSPSPTTWMSAALSR